MPRSAFIRTREETGFTLIEILVVILIIGILAAIAIPSFLSQKDKAGDAAAKTYARSMRTAEETYFSDNDAYTNSYTALKTIEPTLSNRPDGATDPTLTAGPGNAFSAEVKAASGIKYKIARATDGSITRSCDSPSKGGCTASSKW
jgi:type IV pilus assembly protein PilA